MNIIPPFTGCRFFLWKISIHLQDCTLSQAKRWNCQYTLHLGRNLEIYLKNKNNRKNWTNFSRMTTEYVMNVHTWVCIHYIPMWKQLSEIHFPMFNEPKREQAQKWSFRLDETFYPCWWNAHMREWLVSAGRNITSVLVGQWMGDENWHTRGNSYQWACVHSEFYVDWSILETSLSAKCNWNMWKLIRPSMPQRNSEILSSS